MAALLIVGVPVAAVPQPPTGDGPAALEAQKNALFQEMLRNSDNLDAAFAYGELQKNNINGSYSGHLFGTGVQQRRAIPGKRRAAGIR